MHGSREPTFFARLPLAGEEGVVVSEDAQMEAGAGVIVMGLVVGVKVGSAPGTGAGDAIDLSCFHTVLLHDV